MSEPIHTTQTDAALPPRAEHWLTDGLKKQTVTVIFGAMWAFYTFIWNSQSGVADIKRDTEANTKAIEKIIVTNKEQADLQNQFLIGLTKSSEAVNRMALDIRDIQNQQQKNTEQLLNRR